MIIINCIVSNGRGTNMVKIDDNTNYLKEILEKNNISQTEMANKIGQSRINFNKIVNNNRKLDVETARKIGSIINRSWFELFEPIDMEINIHGEVHMDYNIKLYNYIDDEPMSVRLETYLTNRDDILCFIGRETQGLYLADKKYKCDYPSSLTTMRNRKTANGMYYTKLKDGNYIIACQHNTVFFPMSFYKTVFNNKKTKSPISVSLNKKDVEYVMPICRLDFDYEWIAGNWENKLSEVK